MKDFNVRFEEPSGPAVYEPERLAPEQAFMAWMRANAVFDSAMGAPIQDVRELDQAEAAAWFMTFEQLIQELPEWGRLHKSRRLLASQINRSFQCLLDSGGLVEWKDIKPAYQLKWEFMVRAAELVIDFSTDDGAIEFHVDQLGDMFRTMLAGETPKGDDDDDRASPAAGEQGNRPAEPNPVHAADGGAGVRYEATDIAQ